MADDDEDDEEALPPVIAPRPDHTKSVSSCSTYSADLCFSVLQNFFYLCVLAKRYVYELNCCEVLGKSSGVFYFEFAKKMPISCLSVGSEMLKLMLIYLLACAEVMLILKLNMQGGGFLVLKTYS